MSDPWKACDIRGEYPGEVSADLFRQVGAAVGSILPARARVLMAGDFRPSTPDLKSALAEGLLSSGSHVMDAGHIPTPIAYFAHQRWKTAAVLIVTASHNPANHNGLKLMVGELPPTPTDLEELRRQAGDGEFRKQTGSMERVDPIPAYKQWILERWRHLNPPTTTAVVLDAGNGALSELAPQLFEQLGFQVHRLFCKIDGTYPHRLPDCARPGNLKALVNEVVSTGAEVGIAWDGDGDRVAFVDGSGSIVPADEISSLLIQDLVPTATGSKVVYDIKMSDIVRQTIARSGGQGILERSGHTFIKRTMIEQNCLFGCEVSGHYFFRELGGGDDGFFTALLMTDLLKRKGVLLTELRRSLPPYYVTPDLRIPAGILSFAEVADRLRARFQSTRETSIDGIRLETEFGYVLARQSVTEPVITIRLDGFSKQNLSQLISTCFDALPEVSDELANQIPRKTSGPSS